VKRGPLAAAIRPARSWKHSPPTFRACWLFAIVLFVAWTRLYLGVHELKHIGQTDSYSCKIALVTSTVGGGCTQSAPLLIAPADFTTLAIAPVLGPAVSRDVETQQPRAPPVPA